MKKLLFIGVLIISVIILIGLFFLFLIPKSGTKPAKEIVIPTPTPPNTKIYNPNLKLSPLQKTIIGKTTDSVIEQFPNLQKKEVLPDGSTKYSFASQLISRPNEVVTHGGVASFEKILLPLEPEKEGYAKLSDYINVLGQPEKTIKGSNYWGWNVSTYVFASRGVALTTNSYAGLVYEISLFKPTTVENYIQTHGQDINPRLSPPNEGQ